MAKRMKKQVSRSTALVVLPSVPAVIKKRKTRTVGPTRAMADALTRAFHHFNKALFNGKLLPVFIRLSDERYNRFGHYAPGRWEKRAANDGKHIAEIALNSRHFGARTDEDILSTLVHEMVHHQQYLFGKPSAGSHNKEWAAMMRAVGLEPCRNGIVGQPDTGRSVSHVIVEGGRFHEAAKALAEAGFVLPMDDRFGGPDVEPRPGIAIGATPTAGPDSARPTVAGKNRTKTAFACPCCGAKAWGKAELSLACIPCSAATNTLVALQRA